jgi:hypothetical protein
VVVVVVVEVVVVPPTPPPQGRTVLNPSPIQIPGTGRTQVHVPVQLLTVSTQKLLSQVYLQNPHGLGVVVVVVVRTQVQLG